MNLPRRKFLCLAAGAAALPALPHVARAQAYPSRPVRIVVGFPAGGAHDFQARLIGQWLTDRFGKPFVVENRPGASGTIGTEAVVRARPDGYSFVVLGTANTLGALAAEKLSYDVVRDLSPVAGLNTNMFLLLVNPKLPVNTVPELIAHCKANPGKLNFGSAGIGTVQHIGIELFKMMAGVDLTHVPYRGEAPQVTDLIGGQVQVGLVTILSTIEYIRSGTLRALAVTGSVPSPALPHLPTMAHFLPTYEATSFIGVAAPVGTPEDAIHAVNREINAALANPGIQTRYAELGANLLPGAPADFGRLVAEQAEKWTKVMKFAGIKPT
jgi:tripartite-type tricarboxylate transporter receptor subunit TctC